MNARFNFSYFVIITHYSFSPGSRFFDRDRGVGGQVSDSDGCDGCVDFDCQN